MSYTYEQFNLTKTPQAYVEASFDEYGNVCLVGKVKYSIAPPNWYEYIPGCYLTTNLKEFQQVCQRIFNSPKQQVIQRLIDFKFIENTQPIDWTNFGTDKLKSSILPFQKKAIEQVIYQFHGKVLLSAEQGLGKTLMSCCLAKYYHGPSLLVVDAGKVNDWIIECQDWINETPFHIKNKKCNTINEHGINVISNKIVSSMTDLLDRNWSCIIIDESQCMKNPEAKLTKALMTIASKCKQRILLSGTVVSIGNADFYTQLSFLHPIFGTFKEFTSRYADGKQNGIRWEARGSTNLTEIYSILSTMSIRLLKSNCTDLLPCKRNILYIEPTKETIEKFNKLNQELQNLSNEEKKLKSPRATLARQAHVLKMMHETSKSKMQAVQEFIIKISLENQDKWVFWCKSTEMFTFIKQLLIEKQFTYIAINQQIQIKKRPSIIHSFADVNSPNRFALLTYRTCSRGLNLIPACCKAAYFELETTPDQILQAERRLARIGQPKQVTHYYLIAKGTYDKSMWKTLLAREHASSVTLDLQNTRFATNFTESIIPNKQILIDMKIPNVECVKIPIYDDDTQETFIKRAFIPLNGRDFDVPYVFSNFVQEPMIVTKLPLNKIRESNIIQEDVLCILTNNKRFKIE
jgi:SNF2 family DNA or RNA helicase